MFQITIQLENDALYQSFITLSLWELPGSGRYTVVAQFPPLLRQLA